MNFLETWAISQDDLPSQRVINLACLLEDDGTRGRLGMHGWVRDDEAEKVCLIEGSATISSVEASYVPPEPHDSEGHLCGTSACVAGWAVLAAGGRFFLHSSGGTCPWPKVVRVRIPGRADLTDVSGLGFVVGADVLGLRGSNLTAWKEVTDTWSFPHLDVNESDGVALDYMTAVHNCAVDMLDTVEREEWDAGRLEITIERRERAELMLVLEFLDWLVARLVREEKEESRVAAGSEELTNV